MFARFTGRACKVFQLANQEAGRRSHEYVGTEHVLVGLSKEGWGVGANVLKDIGLGLEQVMQAVNKIVSDGPDNGEIVIGRLPLTPRARQVVEVAGKEAAALGHNYVGTEHLLLSLARVEGVAQQVILNVGVDYADIHRSVLDLLGHNMKPQAELKSEPVSHPIGANYMSINATRTVRWTAAEYETVLRVLKTNLPDFRGGKLSAMAVEILQNLKFKPAEPVSQDTITVSGADGVPATRIADENRQLIEDYMAMAVGSVPMYADVAKVQFDKLTEKLTGAGYVHSKVDANTHSFTVRQPHGHAVGDTGNSWRTWGKPMGTPHIQVSVAQAEVEADDVQPLVVGEEASPVGGSCASCGEPTGRACPYCPTAVPLCQYCICPTIDKH